MAVRTTVDIPDDLYKRIKSQAALRGCTVKELILRGVEAEISRSRPRKKRVKLPIFDSKDPGVLSLTNRQINELLFP
ncbi:MAG: hypothetical protein ACKV22_13105 [Bryobacteraceae bacterium]